MNIPKITGKSLIKVFAGAPLEGDPEQPPTTTLPPVIKIQGVSGPVEEPIVEYYYPMIDPYGIVKVRLGTPLEPVWVNATMRKLVVKSFYVKEFTPAGGDPVVLETKDLLPRTLGVSFELKATDVNGSYYGELKIDEKKLNNEYELVKLGVEVTDGLTPVESEIEYAPVGFELKPDFDATSAFFFFEARNATETERTTAVDMLSQNGKDTKLRIQQPGSKSFAVESGLLGGKEYLRFGSGGFSTGQLVNGTAQSYWARGAAYLAIALAIEEGQKFTYGHMPFSITDNANPNDLLRFGFDGVYDPYSGAKWSDIGTSRNQAHLFEFVYPGDGTFTTFLDGVEVYTLTPPSIQSYNPTIFPRNAGIVKIGAIYAVEREVTPSERSSFRTFSQANYGVNF